MAIAPVSVGASNETSAQTIEIAKPAGLSNDNYMILLASTVASGTPLDITVDEASQPWTLIKQEQMSAGLDGTIALFYRKITGTEAATITVNISGGVNRSIQGVIAQWEGIDPTTALDAAATSTTDQSTATYDPPAITTATPNAFVITAYYGRAASITTPDAPGGYTTYGDEKAGNAYVGMAYIDAGAADEEDPPVWGTTTVTADCMGITMALRPSTAASSIPPLAFHHFSKNLG